MPNDRDTPTAPSLDGEREAQIRKALTGAGWNGIVGGWDVGAEARGWASATEAAARFAQACSGGNYADRTHTAVGIRALKPPTTTEEDGR